ncbi:MAG: DUF924 family protein [Halioglobus sp.]
MNDCIDDILDFWFGELDSAGIPVTNRNPLWFSRDDAVDAELQQRFGSWLQRGAAGELDHWAQDDRGLVALVILLDQFSRNIHRGSPLSFAADARALGLARAAIDSGRHEGLPIVHRAFLYMPLEHCEDLGAQEDCIALFATLADASGGHDIIRSFERYAVAHRDVIARFARFPHRNALLGRTSSEEELDYLEKHGGF